MRNHTTPRACSVCNEMLYVTHETARDIFRTIDKAHRSATRVIISFALKQAQRPSSFVSAKNSHIRVYLQWHNGIPLIQLIRMCETQRVTHLRNTVNHISRCGVLLASVTLASFPHTLRNLLYVIRTNANTHSSSTNARFRLRAGALKINLTTTFARN